MSGLQENTSQQNGHSKGPETVRKSLVDIISCGTELAWNQKTKDANLEKFKEALQEKYQVKFENYWDLHKWSTENYGKFWEEIWNYYNVIYSKPHDDVVVNGKGFIDIDWFSGARFNYAENMLRFRDDHVAIICADEEGDEERITYAEMYDEVKLYAAAFKKWGLQMGDRIACYMSNRKEAVFAMLAGASMGALWGGPLPFYGAKAAANIVKLMSPKFLLTMDRFLDNKIEKSLLKNLPTVANGVSSIEKVIIVPTKESTKSSDISMIEKSCFLDEFLAVGRNPDGSVPDLVFEQLPFNYPVCINFTSGTTGSPKGLVHSAGSFLPLLRDFGLHCNLKRGDVVMTMYPVGWNLWNLFIANFALGTTLLLYNGCPFYLGPHDFWDIMGTYKVAYTFLVTSIVDKMEKENVVPGPNTDLSHLKMITIGASPVKLQNFDYLLNRVKKDMFVTCLYGATEVIGVFSGTDWNEPAYSAEIQVAALGVDLRCYDESGNSVIGQEGELVIATPTPSLPIFVWNDNNKKRLHELYFSKYPGIWSQNDLCWIDPRTKGIIIIGRSDETLNPNGERFGSADMYFAIHNVKEISDSICVPQYKSNGDQRAILFVVMANGYAFTPAMEKKIKQTVSDELTSEHVPEIVMECPDVPYNMNGKKMERLVMKIIETNQVPEVINIRNPDCLKFFCNIPQLQNV